MGLKAVILFKWFSFTSNIEVHLSFVFPRCIYVVPECTQSSARKSTAETSMDSSSDHAEWLQLVGLFLNLLTIIRSIFAFCAAFDPSGMFESLYQSHLMLCSRKNVTAQCDLSGRPLCVDKMCHFPLMNWLMWVTDCVTTNGRGPV